MQNYCLKNIQSNVFRKGFCPYQNPLIQVIHLFIIRDKIPYELVFEFDISLFSSYVLSVVDRFSYRAFELKERDRNCIVSVSSIRVMHLPRAYLRPP